MSENYNNMMTATYSPEDNKLRLSSVTRLDAETYKRVKDAGFIWAPKQQIFVAPMWTPEREDLLLELCGEIGDEDTSLVERAEQRAERFEEYSENRAEDAQRARNAVSAIADNIPLGQPILVGHHSERHARKDAEKIENGMRRAVKMWETSSYWKQRAAGAIRAAKYKELPTVRARRIKTLEAEQRKQERAKEKAELCLKLWTKDGLTHEQALFIAGHSEAGWLHMPKKDGDKPDWNQCPTAHTALTGACPNLYAPRTLDEIVEQAKRVYPATMAYCDRWIAHLSNRLEYERAMLDEQGASKLLEKKPRPKLLPLCNYRAPEGLNIPNSYHRGEMLHYAQVEMTQAEYAKIWNDYKGTHVVDNSHRVRTAVLPNHSHVCVFLTDSKVHERPAPIEPESPTLRERPAPTYTPKPEPERSEFDAMRETLKAGVQVVTAPQLFPTPPELARRMVEIAGVQAGDTVLEPSAGTGNIARAVIDAVDTEVLAYEVNPQLCSHMRRTLPDWKVKVECRDFLSVTDFQGCYPFVLMNPPFENGSDIKHIEHARKFLKPGGVLVAICANGPRQREKLQPIADTWEDLPADTFKAAGTGVNTALLVIRA